MDHIIRYMESIDPSLEVSLVPARGHLRKFWLIYISFFLYVESQIIDFSNFSLNLDIYLCEFTRIQYF